MLFGAVKRERNEPEWSEPTERERSESDEGKGEGESKGEGKGEGLSDDVFVELTIFGAGPRLGNASGEVGASPTFSLSPVYPVTCAGFSA